MANSDIEVVDFSYLTENDVPISSGPGELAVADRKKRVRDTKRIKVKPDKSKDDNVEKVDGEVVSDGDEKSINNYRDTMAALRNTVVELDVLANEMKADLDAVRASRTLKGRYQYTSMLGQNISQVLSTKVQAIKEMNTTIKNAVELDYRIRKDNRELANAGNDDQRLMDMYNAFVSAPNGMAANASVLGPTVQQMMLPGSASDNTTQFSRGPIDDSNPLAQPGMDPGYAAYLQHMSPEQSRMLLEGNPDVKEVVVYNPSTGEKHFAVQNTATGEFLEGVAHHDDMFLEDCSINTRNGIVRNTNLNMSFPLVTVGEEKMKGF